MNTNTAHADWEETWRTVAGRSAWLDPERDVMDVIPLLKQRRVEAVLDLGCGVGRHSMLLAREGFQVSAVDGSESGVAFLVEQAATAGLTLTTRVAEMTTLPFENARFDYVLAWNVIYHGDLPVVTRVISEITRILRVGGLCHATVLSRRNSDVLAGTKIAHGTYVNEAVPEKSHPHFSCDSRELVGLFTGYEIWNVKDIDHTGSGSFHWHLLAEKL